VPAVGYFRLGWNSILAFWFAYVVTRPVGASVADWLGVSSARGGLALGTGPVSVVLAAAIAGFVYYLSKTGKDTPPDQGATATSGAGHGSPRTVFGGREQAPEQA
jgi:uncharacterized membrane-anchored protein